MDEYVKVCKFGRPEGMPRSLLRRDTFDYVICNEWQLPVTRQQNDDVAWSARCLSDLAYAREIFRAYCMPEIWIPPLVTQQRGVMMSKSLFLFFSCALAIYRHVENQRHYRGTFRTVCAVSGEHRMLLTPLWGEPLPRAPCGFIRLFGFMRFKRGNNSLTPSVRKYETR